MIDGGIRREFSVAVHDDDDVVDRHKTFIPKETCSMLCTTVLWPGQHEPYFGSPCYNRVSGKLARFNVSLMSRGVRFSMLSARRRKI